MRCQNLNQIMISDFPATQAHGPNKIAKENASALTSMRIKSNLNTRRLIQRS
jgi:hypothetical protein